MWPGLSKISGWDVRLTVKPLEKTPLVETPELTARERQLLEAARGVRGVEPISACACRGQSCRGTLMRMLRFQSC